MSMTKKVVSVWARVPTKEDDSELWNEREGFLQSALDAGKTDSLTPTMIIGESTYSRNWKDESAANEWIAFLNGLSAKYEIEVTTTIESI